MNGGTRVLEIGAGLGSLTVALARTGARVVAVELDRALIAPLSEVTTALANVRVLADDAMTADWSTLLHGEPWTVVANLPYNVAVPVVIRLLSDEPRVERMVVMVQREVGERLAAAPGSEPYGAVSVRVAYFARATVIRRVSPTVFWPRPNVESVLVSIVRRPPPVDVDQARLWDVVGAGFAQRRKTMRSALVRLGCGADEARAILEHCGLEASVRAEALGLPALACVANMLAASP